MPMLNTQSFRIIHLKAVGLSTINFPYYLKQKEAFIQIFEYKSDFRSFGTLLLEKRLIELKVMSLTVFTSSNKIEIIYKNKSLNLSFQFRELMYRFSIPIHVRGMSDVYI